MNYSTHRDLAAKYERILNELRDKFSDFVRDYSVCNQRATDAENIYNNIIAEKKELTKAGAWDLKKLTDAISDFNRFYGELKRYSKRISYLISDLQNLGLHGDALEEIELDQKGVTEKMNELSKKDEQFDGYMAEISPKKDDE